MRHMQDRPVYNHLGYRPWGYRTTQDSNLMNPKPNPGHMNIRGPQLFYSFLIRWMKVVRIGALLADWSCAS